MSVNGQSVSSAQATLLAGAFINGVASASVCSSCSTQATLVAERISTAILDAVAVAEIALRDTSSGAPRTLVENQFAETVVNGTAIVVGEVTPPSPPQCVDEDSVSYMASCSPLAPLVLYGTYTFRPLAQAQLSLTACVKHLRTSPVRHI